MVESVESDDEDDESDEDDIVFVTSFFFVRTTPSEGVDNELPLSIFFATPRESES